VQATKRKPSSSSSRSGATCEREGVGVPSFPGTAWDGIIRLIAAAVLVPAHLRDQPEGE